MPDVTALAVAAKSSALLICVQYPRSRQRKSLPGQLKYCREIEHVTGIILLSGGDKG